MLVEASASHGLHDLMVVLWSLTLFSREGHVVVHVEIVTFTSFFTFRVVASNFFRWVASLGFVFFLSCTSLLGSTLVFGA
jgi:hypothetical protein